MNKSEIKQTINKQDVINLLNSMINQKNTDSINQYIYKILTIDDASFQQELGSKNISTIEDVKRFFVGKFSKLERLENDKTEQSNDLQEFKKCTLNNLDIENTYFHFTDKAYIKSIRSKGLISDIGKHSRGIDEKPSIFFSYGMIPTIQGADVWMKWIMNRMYGERNQFHIYDGLDEIKIKSKQSEWEKEFLNKEYLSDDERKGKTFELVFNALKEKVFLNVDLKPEIDFSFDDIDYNKQKAQENGEVIPYLFMKEMYGDYSDLNSTIMDKWNMHTFFGTQIEPERIMQVTDSKGRTDMLHILIEMYDRCKSFGDFQIDILDDFISYAKQKELSKEQISTQRLCQETLEEQNNIALLDEIESVQVRQERVIIQQQKAQENGQNR